MTTAEVVHAIIELLALGVTTAYVILTRMTFKEIKKQTDLQSEALMSVTADVSQPPSAREELWMPYIATTSVGVSTWAVPQEPRSRPSARTTPPRTLDEGVTQLHAKWKEMLKTQAPHALARPDQLVTLRLRNRGRSDIVAWKIKVSLEVEPGDHLKTQFQQTGNTYSWAVESRGAADIIDVDGEVVVPISPAGQFPLAKFSWSVEYDDALGKHYERRFVGDRGITDSNAFATAPSPPALPAPAASSPVAAAEAEDPVPVGATPPAKTQ